MVARRHDNLRPLDPIARAQSFAEYSPFIRLYPCPATTALARTKVYMYFFLRDGWQVQFLEADLKIPRPRKLISLLLKICLLEGPRIFSKTLADELFLPPGEVSKSLNRCKESGLLYWSDLEKRVNRSALLDFLAYGVRHVFPPTRGALVRGVPTAAAAEPLKSHFLDDGEPPPVWPYSEGSVRGLSFSPLYKSAPKAALLDSRLYELLALCDAIRSGRTRERVLAVELLRKALNA